MLELETLVHIGPYKTGSTSLQEYLSNNYDWLLEHGILYSKAGRYAKSGKLDRGHNSLFHAARLVDDAWYQRQINELHHEIVTHTPKMLILSSEVASRESLTQDFYDLIAQTIPGSKRNILLYVRRQDELLLSRYSQRVKTGNLRWPKSIQHLNSPKFLDHQLRIEHIKRALPDFGMEIRSFDLDKSRLVPSFLKHIGIHESDPAQPLVHMNPKRSWGVTWFGRYLNILPRSLAKHILALLNKIDKKLHERDIRFLDRFSKPLNSQQCGDIIEQYAESNSWLADEYFGGLDPFGPRSCSPLSIKNRSMR